MTSPAQRPSRILLVVAGVVTMVLGLGCLVLALASLPLAHDLHQGMHVVAASVVAAIAAIVCGVLMWRGRLVPLALAIGIDVGFGIVLPRGGSALGALLRMLPADDASAAETAITVGAIAMFASAVLCALAIPAALAWRRWERGGGAVGAEGDAAGGGGGGGGGIAASTLPGVGPNRMTATQIVRVDATRSGARGRGLIIAAVAVTCVIAGVVVIALATGGGGGGGGSKASGVGPQASGSETGSQATGSAIEVSAITGTGSAAGSATGSGTGMDGGVGDAGVTPTIEEFAGQWHVALEKRAFGELLDDKAFAFGPGAHDVVQGKAAIATVLGKELGDAHDVRVRFSQLGHEGEAGWVAEELAVGGRVYVVTWIAGLHAGAWTIAALSWAVALPNDAAYREARDGSLAVPDAIPDSHDESDLATAMRTAFASRPSFAAARSTRPDGFNFGSAPGERISGGDAVKRTFAHLRATIRLHDAVAVGTVSDRVGWGAANVDFTDADRDGTQVTQTFRVLAAWVKEDAGWRMVQTQWSNPR